jgi:hypothetical protein
MDCYYGDLIKGDDAQTSNERLSDDVADFSERNPQLEARALL